MDDLTYVSGKKLPLSYRKEYAKLIAAVIIISYFIIVIAPIISIVVFRLKTDRGLFYELGRVFALIGFPIIALQLVITTKIKGLFRTFGLDIVYVFHKYIGIFAALLFIAHPVFLAIGKGDFEILISIYQPWYIWMGKIALTFLVLQWLFSVYFKFFKIDYKIWRLWHNIFALIIFGFGFYHGIKSGIDLIVVPMLRIIFYIIFILTFIAYLYNKIMYLLRIKNNYTVEEVIQETFDVWTLKLRPDNGKVIDYLPGQFQFLTLYGKNIPTEEHPFTISSSPTEKNILKLSIKELGDYTSKISDIVPGDKAVINGPFGRFSFILNKKNKLVFIAGGIGITPIRSMIKYMYDKGINLETTLLFGNRTEKDIVFFKEFEEIKKKMNIKIVNVISHLSNTWNGEKGHVDYNIIKKHCKDIQNSDFYICGPPKMMENVIQSLKQLGVNDKNIYFEKFKF